MSNKRNRDPFSDRYDSDESETLNDSSTSKTSSSSNSEKTSNTSKSTKSVRQRRNVNMYLPDELVDELQLRYAELNVQYRREHGDDMPKNSVYYPAVIRAALNDTTVQNELDK